MEQYMQELERISRDEKNIGLYDAEKVDKKIRNTQIKGARMEGKVESQIEIAHNLIKMGMPIHQISEVTSLSIDEIEKLRV